MHFLGLDFGSSSVKAAIFKNGRPIKIVHGFYKTHFDGIRAEVDPNSLLRGLKDALTQLGPAATKVDHVAIDVMAPAWIAMDPAGKALTPIVTHQDRRSVEIAHEIEKRIGQKQHLARTGNRPIPGGISSTTWSWFTRHEPALMNKADLVGHLNTFLHRTLTGARVIDPSNASFTGVYSTPTLAGWDTDLCNELGLNTRLLPTILEGDQIAGHVTAAAAKRFGIRAGTPVLTGVMDTSSTLLLRGAKPGQLLNVCGSTDVLLLCTEHPKPMPDLLTRAVGVGRRWVQVSTLAAAGSALNWARKQLFADMPEKEFFKLLRKLAKKPIKPGLSFDPYLAGDRTSLDQKTAAFTGVTLATTRDDLVAVMVDSLARAGAERLEKLRMTGTPMSHDVLLSGGLVRDLGTILHDRWDGKWTFETVEEATLKGLAKLIPRE